MIKKILIVDDDPRNIFALKLTLKARGYKIVSSTTGKEAIQILEQDSEIKVVGTAKDGLEALKKAEELTLIIKLYKTYHYNETKASAGFKW